ncbi:MAG: CBS domain-containing protein, partial [Planctomycetota bacterium]
MEETVERPPKIVAISLDETVQSAANKMSDNKIGCLIVNDRNGQFAGIVTERDIVTRAVVSSIDLEKTPVTEIMTPQVVLCPLGTPTSKAREIMAANHIRHLPVIDRGVVVDILSARDLMGQQRLEDRAAAEEVAMLSNCLKSIELGEAADTVAREVPRLFQAARCILCLWRRPPGLRDKSEKRQTKGQALPAVMGNNRCLCARNRCLCAREKIEYPAGDKAPFDESGFYHESTPDDCRKAGANGPRLVIPLSISALKNAREHELSGYLCMCGLSDCSTLNRELISYKAKLTREILTSHLTNASLYHQARITSLTDALTGVGSRRLLEDKL